MSSLLLAGRRVLVTGAGAPRGVAVLRQLAQCGAEIFASDVSFHAAGLHLVPRGRRMVLSPPDVSDHVPELLRECRRRCIEAVVPTEPEGFIGLAAARALFETYGVAVLAPCMESAGACLDRLRFHHQVRSLFPTPKVIGVSSPCDLARLPRPYEIEGRDPESGVERAFVFDAPEHLRRVQSFRAVARRILPGMELGVLTMGFGGVAESCVVVEHFRRLGESVPGASRVIHDREVEALASSVFEHLGLEGLATVRVVRNLLGKPEVVSVDPFPDASVRLAARAGRDLLGVAIARLLGVPCEVGPEPPEEIAAVPMPDELFIDSRSIFDTADLSDWAAGPGGSSRAAEI